MEGNGSLELNEKITREQSMKAVPGSHLLEVMELSANIAHKTIEESMDELQNQTEQGTYVSPIQSEMKSGSDVTKDTDETKDSSPPLEINSATEEPDTTPTTFKVDDTDVTSSLSSSSSADESDEKSTENLKQKEISADALDSNREAEITPETAAEAKETFDHIAEQLELEDKEVVIKKPDSLMEELEMENRKNENTLESSPQDSKEIRNLQKSLSDAEKQNEKLDNQLTKFQEINRKLEEDLTSKSSELEGTTIVLHQRDESISSLRAELKELQSTKDSVTSDLENTRAELSDAKMTLETSENAMKEMDEKIEELQAKHDSKEQEISKLKDDLEIANNDLGRAGQEKSLTESQLQDDLEKAKSDIRSRNQDISKLEAKLSNSQTFAEKAELDALKLKEEIQSLKDKIKWLEKKRASEKSTVTSPRSGTPSPTRSDTQLQADQIDKRLSLETQRRNQDRIQELQQKVIQVNADNQKIKADYDEAVKALEAVDKVYSVREMALQKYKGELDEANELLKRDAAEIEHLKQEQTQLKAELKRAEESKAEREELREQIARAKEAANMYKDELEHVRKDLGDQVHELNLSQARARERGKKIQIMDLELREVKDTLLISKNVIEEKEKNMTSIKESLEAEKQRVKKLEREIEELSFLKKKLEFTVEEKARVEGKLKIKEQELRETRDRLNNVINKKKEQEHELLAVDREHKKTKKRCEDREQEITILKQIVEGKESDIEEQLMELIHLRGQIDDLNQQLTEIWASYSADKAYWRNKAERSFTSRRRPRSAPPKKVNKNSPPDPRGQSGTRTMAHRRLVNKLGVSLINPNYIQTQHRNIPKIPEGSQPANDNGTHTDGPPPPDQTNGTDNSLVPLTENNNESAPPRLSPRPPDTQKSPEWKHRPLSSYGIRTYPPSGGTLEVEDLWMERGSLTSGDSEEQFAKHVVHQGDRVMIQSDIMGDGTMNVSGVVKYVGKVGTKSAGSGVYVGLKLDQPFGDNSGVVGGKRYFKCQPKHGKLVKVSDIQAIMHPKTQNYERVKPITLD